jgi:hypothetical protein
MRNHNQIRFASHGLFDQHSRITAKIIIWEYILYLRASMTWNNIAFRATKCTRDQGHFNSKSTGVRRGLIVDSAHNSEVSR